MNTHFITKRLTVLSNRERDVLRLIAKGLTTEQIAHQLHRSECTINNHRANISRKLELEGCFSLMRFAQEHRQYLSEN